MALTYLTHYLSLDLRFGVSSDLAFISSFGTLTSFRMSESKFPKPLGFFSWSATACLLCFVDLNSAVHLVKRVCLHRLSDSMEHVPSGLLRYTNRPSQFVTANPVFAIGNRPDCDKPLVETERRVLENRSNLVAELFLAGCPVALQDTGP